MSNTSNGAISVGPKEKKMKESLFDDLDKNVRESFKMWSKNVPLLPKKTDQRSIEGTLFKKSVRKGYWKSKKYELVGNKLIKINIETGKIEGFACVENHRLEKIKYEEKGDKDVKYGFRLSHNGQYVELYARSKESMNQWFTCLKHQCVLTTFNNDYQAIKLMGKGNFARVYYARSKLDGGEFAVKAFEKEKFAQIEVDRPALIKEISILRKMNHPGVIKMYEVYENDTHIFLINELLKGGELFHKLKGHGQFDEIYVAQLMTTLLDSIDYISKRNILHRDIKPENLILRSKTDDTDLCLADFGLADYYDPKGGYMFQRCGTPGYVAPEVLADKIYDDKVDSFSAGVIMFILLTGSSPFKGKSYDEIVIKNYNCTIDFNYKDMNTFLSPECYDLLQKLLKKDPVERYSASQALQHPWFLKMINTNTSSNEDSSTSIKINKNNAVASPININNIQNGTSDKQPTPPQSQQSQSIKQRSSLTSLEDQQIVRIAPKDNYQLKSKTPLMNSKWEAPTEYQSPDTWKKQQQALLQIASSVGRSNSEFFDSPSSKGNDSPQVKTPGGSQYSQPFNGNMKKVENANNSQVLHKMTSVPELNDEYDNEINKEESGKQQLSQQSQSQSMLSPQSQQQHLLLKGHQRKFKEGFQSPVLKNSSSILQKQKSLQPQLNTYSQNNNNNGNNNGNGNLNNTNQSMNQTLNQSNYDSNQKQTKSIREKLIQHV